MKLLFVGESWLGSCARSLKEALGRRADIVLEEVNEDLWVPKPKARVLRALNRLTASAHRRELENEVLERVQDLRPDVVVVYKGSPVHAEFVKAIAARGPRTVNVYPDCSPHAFGDRHRHAVGAYDLVISSKPYHRALWKQLYGYNNRCEFVPQGYDPFLHLAVSRPQTYEFDVVIVATWRAQYGRLLQEVAQCLGHHPLRVAVAGNGWERQRAGLPRGWRFPGAVRGRQYVEWLRKGRICIAPLHREVVINGHRQPGDVDTTRTYELAAAHCFFIHRRTDFVKTLYDEATEVPMFDDAAELAAHIRHYLSREADCARMALAAHRRAVPAYSMDTRAEQIGVLLRELVT